MVLFWRPILASLLISSAAWAGVVVTTTGERVEGELKKTASGWRVTQADGKVREIDSTDIRAIELNSAGSGNQMERLESLRRSVDAFEDIPKIIDRYRRFIEQVKDKAVIDAALADLATWQDRLDRGLVKVGKRWLTPEQKRELAVDIIRRVDQARQQIKNRDTASAQATIDSILADEPDNLSALYLTGVLLQQQGKLNDAETAFRAVTKSIPTHAPTLNNLAVLNARQKQWSAAAAMMEQALAAEPDVQVLVDAAAELLDMLPEDQRKSASAQKLAQRFAAQDAAMQKVMEGKQMYRWGAKWVDQATRDQLVEADKAVKKRIEELQGDYDLTQNRIDRIDVEITQNERTLREIESRSFIRTGDGSYIRVPYPPAYYDIQRDINKLRAERGEMGKRLDALRDAAKRAQADLPVPKFAGSIVPIGEDGVPIVVPAGVDLKDVHPQPPAPPPTTQQAPPPPPPPIIRIGPAGD